MKKVLLGMSLILVSLSAQAQDINKCPQNVQDIMTDISNETSASHGGFFNQLGEKRANAINGLADSIIKNADSCDAVAASLQYIDDNFVVLFNVKN